MKTQISFTTDLFESRDVKPHFINERCFGEDLAIWIIENTTKSEFTFGGPVQEDWGWELSVEADGEKFIVGIGIIDDSIGEDQADWIVFVRKQRKWNLFGSKDSPLRHRLCDLLQNIFRSEPQIREVRWED